MASPRPAGAPTPTPSDRACSTRSRQAWLHDAKSKVSISPASPVAARRCPAPGSGSARLPACLGNRPADPRHAGSPRAAGPEAFGPTRCGRPVAPVLPAPARSWRVRRRVSWAWGQGSAQALSENAEFYDPRPAPAHSPRNRTITQTGCGNPDTYTPTAYNPLLLQPAP